MTEDEGTRGEPSGEAEDVVRMLEASVDGVLRQNEDAREAHRALLERGVSREEARREIARVLLAVMTHVDRQSGRLREAGGGSGLRSEAFRRLAAGERVDDIFG